MDCENQSGLLPSLEEIANLRTALADFITGLLTSGLTQPAAGEFLALVEKRFGWRARHELLAAVHKLHENPTLPGYQRAYVKTALSDDEINTALRGEARWTHEDHATLDELFRRSAAYRNSGAFREMMQFTARFREYAPFNNLLVRLQNPSCGFFATESDWRKKFRRLIKLDARPMLILAPRHPVMLVYDLDSTQPDPDSSETVPLPEQLETFASVEGEWNPDALPKLVANAERDRIKVEFKPLSSTNAGCATTRVEGPDWKMRVIIHDVLDERSRFATLCHELAHIYLGHLGADGEGWWPSRINLNHATIEIEAEAAAYIISVRLGLRPSSAQYVSAYLKTGEVPASVSAEMIVKIAGKLEEMSRTVAISVDALGGRGALSVEVSSGQAAGRPVTRPASAVTV